MRCAAIDRPRRPPWRVGVARRAPRAARPRARAAPDNPGTSHAAPRARIETSQRDVTHVVINTANFLRVLLSQGLSHRRLRAAAPLHVLRRPPAHSPNPRAACITHQAWKMHTVWKMPTNMPRRPPTAISFHSSSSKTGATSEEGGWTEEPKGARVPGRHRARKCIEAPPRAWVQHALELLARQPLQPHAQQLLHPERLLRVRVRRHDAPDPTKKKKARKSRSPGARVASAGSRAGLRNRSESQVWGRRRTWASRA